MPTLALVERGTQSARTDEQPVRIVFKTLPKFPKKLLVQSMRSRGSLNDGNSPFAPPTLRTMMLRTHITIAASAALLISLVSIPPAFASAGDPSADWLPEITDSSALTSTPTVQGVLRHTDGSPFAKGSNVLLTVEPSAESLKAMAIGDSYNIVPVAKAVVGAEGQFTLRVANPAALTQFEDKGSDDVLFDIKSADNGELADFTLSRQVVASGAQAELVDPGSASGSLSVSSLKSLDATKITGDPVDITAIVNKNVPADLVGRDVAAPKTLVCQSVKDNEWTGISTRVGGSYETAAAAQKFHYETGQSTTISTELSASGSYGSWTLSGSESRTAQSTTDFGWDTTKNGVAYWTNWTYDEFHDVCHDIEDPGYTTYGNWRTLATVNDGGGNSTAINGLPAANNCAATLGVGVTWSTQSETAYTFGSGGQLQSYIGVAASTQTGYTSQAQITYKNTSNATLEHLCGSNAVASQAELVVLK